MKVAVFEGVCLFLFPLLKVLLFFLKDFIVLIGNKGIAVLFLEMVLKAIAISFG